MTQVEVVVFGMRYRVTFSVDWRAVGVLRLFDPQRVHRNRYRQIAITSKRAGEAVALARKNLSSNRDVG